MVIQPQQIPIPPVDPLQSRENYEQTRIVLRQLSMLRAPELFLFMVSPNNSYTKQELFSLRTCIIHSGCVMEVSDLRESFWAPPA
jgi:hypothetical protein